jgi:hypothetical protein
MDRVGKYAFKQEDVHWEMQNAILGINRHGVRSSLNSRNPIDKFYI